MRLLGAVMLLLGVLGATPAAAQVVTLGRHPDLSLRQGPMVAGEQMAWSQTRCIAGCGPSFDVTNHLYELRMAGDGAARTLFRAREASAYLRSRTMLRTISFLASDRALVTLHWTTRTDEIGNEIDRVVVRAGAPGTRRPVLVDCRAELVGGRAPLALDDNRLAYDPDPCDGVPRLVVRDLGSGATTALPEPAGSVFVALRDRFVAWIEGLGAEERLVAYDLMAGATAYSAPADGVTAFDMDADGTVAAVRGLPAWPCSAGRLLRYSVAAPGPADLGPACATGVAIDAGRIVYMRSERSFRMLSAVGIDDAAQDLVRFGRVRPGRFDFAAGRIAWAARDCGGGEALFTARLAEAPVSAGSVNCRVRLLPGAVPVRRGVATVRLRCPRGCFGFLRLRNMGVREFSLMPGERAVRIRLRRRARARLERRGSLEALAKAMTFDRADEARVDRRAVRLVAR